MTQPTDAVRSEEIPTRPAPPPADTISKLEGLGESWSAGDWIADDGTITIASVNKEAADDARRRIEQITADIEPGQVFDGKVARIMDFGAFVTIAPGKDGLVHVSGAVSSQSERDAVRVVAEGVRGVKGVFDHLSLA